MITIISLSAKHMICLSSTDYLVDEGTECNSTSDLLLERSREKSLVDLLIPLLVLLITLLKKLQVCCIAISSFSFRMCFSYIIFLFLIWKFI